MGATTEISWTESTWNPLRGCTRVSPGCGGPGPYGGCYAEGIAARFSGPGQPFEGIAEMRGGKPRWTGKLALAENALTLPLTWRKPRRIFVNSMSDLFHEKVPDAWIDRIFAVMALCPQHTFQVLTKRSARMRAYFTAPRRLDARDGSHSVEVPADKPRDWHHAAGSIVAMDGQQKAQWGAFRWSGECWEMPPVALPNVWLGVSAEDQRRADERVPDLLATPAAVRFVSAEPLLGPIDFSAIACPTGCTPPEYCNYCHPDGGTATGEVDAIGGSMLGSIDWVIVGGESGPGARPFALGWAKDIVSQCEAAGVAVFVKQIGARPTNREGVPYPAQDRKGGDPAEWPAEIRVRQMPAPAIQSATQS